MSADVEDDQGDEGRPADAAPTPPAPPTTVPDVERRLESCPAPAASRRISWGAGPPDGPAAEKAPEPTPKPPVEDLRKWPSPTVAVSPEGPVTTPVSVGPSPVRITTPPPAPPPTPPAPRRPAATEHAPADEGPASPTSPSPRPPGKPASISDLAEQLTAIQRRLDALGEDGGAGGRSPAIERRAAERADATLSHLTQQFAALQSQLGAVGEQLTGVGAAGSAPDHRALERTAGAITELSQQLAATQAQVAAVAAQLTTLAHRVTYDLERSGQTTVERVLRDLPHEVGALLGPAIDDLTDQVEADTTRLTEALEGDLGTRLTGMAEIVDSLPLANVELLSALRALEGDLEDRFSRLAERLGDQVTAFEEANAAELTRLREHIFDIADGQAGAAADREILDRMAGQVERLAEGANTTEALEAVELLIAEHLEVLRDELETRDAATAARLDAALGEQIEALDALVTERLEHAIERALGEVTESTEARLDALAAAGAASATAEAAIGDQLAALVAAVEEKQAANRSSAPARGADEGYGDQLAVITEELKALRRRLPLRPEADEPGPAPDRRGTRTRTPLRAAPDPTRTPQVARDL